MLFRSAINEDAAGAYRDADGLGLQMGPTIGMISNIGLAAIGLGGAVLYLFRIVDLGQISSFVLYSRKFSGPINEIANIINEIFSALAASERIFQLLDEPEETADRPGALCLTGCRGCAGAGRELWLSARQNRAARPEPGGKARPDHRHCGAPRRRQDHHHQSADAVL